MCDAGLPTVESDPGARLSAPARHPAVAIRAAVATRWPAAGYAAVAVVAVPAGSVVPAAVAEAAVAGWAAAAVVAVGVVRQQITQFLRENGGHLKQPVSLILLSD